MKPGAMPGFVAFGARAISPRQLRKLPELWFAAASPSAPQA
jgi:hypothetical protein